LIAHEYTFTQRSLAASLHDHFNTTTNLLIDDHRHHQQRSYDIIPIMPSIILLQPHVGRFLASDPDFLLTFRQRLAIKWYLRDVGLLL